MSVSVLGRRLEPGQIPAHRAFVRVASGLCVLCVPLWQVNQAKLAAKERKERKRQEMKWPPAIGDFVRCVRLVVFRPPKRFPSYPKRCLLFPSAPKRCQAIPKRFPNLLNPLFNRFHLKRMAIFREISNRRAKYFLRDLCRGARAPAHCRPRYSHRLGSQPKKCAILCSFVQSSGRIAQSRVNVTAWSPPTASIGRT